MNLPQEYIDKMKNLLNEDFQSYLDCFSRPSFNGLRVNTSKISVEEFLRIAPFKLEPVPWCKEGFYYQEEDKVSLHPYYNAGLYYLQEPSAMAPASLLPVEKDNIVLDCCRAPGGKTTQIASRIPDGLLISNDISSSRQQATLKNIEKAGFSNVYVTSTDIENLPEKSFDRILLDAPCSGEGMFRKDPSLITSWSKRNSEYYAPIQKELIDKAIPLLKDGGLLMYSTCTFDPGEDEEVIQYALDNHPDVSLMEIPHHELFEPGINGLSKCVRLYPHKINGEGHFLALLKKEGTSPKTESRTNTSFNNESVNEFLSLINYDFSTGTIRKIDDRIIFTQHDFNTSGIMTLRSGLLLGTLKNNRFEPSQHLAMSLKAEQFANVINLEADDERVLKYLKGETIYFESEIQGWVLICVSGYPLGFGKINKNRIKNKIEAGHRKL